MESSVTVGCYCAAIKDEPDWDAIDLGTMKKEVPSLAEQTSKADIKTVECLEFTSDITPDGQVKVETVVKEDKDIANDWPSLQLTDTKDDVKHWTVSASAILPCVKVEGDLDKLRDGIKTAYPGSPRKDSHQGSEVSVTYKKEHTDSHQIITPQSQFIDRGADKNDITITPSVIVITPGRLTPGFTTREHTPGGTTREHTTGVTTREHTLGVTTRENTPGVTTREHTPGGTTGEHTPGVTTREHTTGVITTEHTPGGSTWKLPPGVSTREHTPGGSTWKLPPGVTTGGHTPGGSTLSESCDSMKTPESGRFFLSLTSSPPGGSTAQCNTHEESRLFDNCAKKSRQGDVSSQPNTGRAANKRPRSSTGKHSKAVPKRKKPALKEKCPCKCPVCGHAFPSDGLLLRHKQRHNNGEPYQCSVCQKLFCVKTTFHRHQLMHVWDEVKQVYDPL